MTLIRLFAVHVLVLLAIAVSGVVASQAIAGHAAAWRPVEGQMAACPAAGAERPR